MINKMTCLMTILTLTSSVAGAEEPKVLPSAEQVAWQDCELGMFIHFAPNTWQDKEGDDRSTPLEKINPEKLDTDQWVSVAESMGAKYIVFVAKHVGGFCMWQTDTTEYGIKNTSWRGGKGDVLADLSASCKKRGMKLGLYLSPRDDTLGADTGGRCKSPEAQAKYDEIYRRQLTEVLSRYGELFEVWFDGSNIIEVGDILKKHAPHAMVFQGKYTTIRWVGNEDGYAPYPAWSAVTKEARDRGPTAADGTPTGDCWLPNECDARIRRDWFWSSKNADTLKSVDQLMRMYYGSVGRGAVLLLNNTPDTSGLIPEMDARRTAEFGVEIRKRLGSPVAQTSGEGDTLDLSFDKPTKIDHIVIMEDIARGERVRKYAIETEVEAGKWTMVAEGTAIGHKRIHGTAKYADPMADCVTKKLRLRVDKSQGTPAIKMFAAH